MGVKVFLFLCNLLIPLIMLIAGYFMYKFPPKSINGFYGYRTSMSRKNMDTWKFAHIYCGRLWIYVGLIAGVISIIVQLLLIRASSEAFGTATLVIELSQLVVIIGSIFFVERALRRNFDKFGNRKL